MCVCVCMCENVCVIECVCVLQFCIISGVLGSCRVNIVIDHSYLKYSSTGAVVIVVCSSTFPFSVSLRLFLFLTW